MDGVPAPIVDHVGGGEERKILGPLCQQSHHINWDYISLNFFSMRKQPTSYVEATVVNPELIKWVNSCEVLFSCEDLCEKARRHL